MCGICGVIAPADTERADLVRRMARAMTHRGPDADGFHEDDCAALGMRRLSIIDVAGGGQPVYDESGSIAAVFNGEIYNFADLRQRLAGKGHRFTSGSDSEVIPHLYEEYGPDFAHELRGMFAIAVWDHADRTLVLARDRLGKKPLYFSAHGGRIVFGSELKAVLADDRIERVPSAHAISQYLTYQYIPAPLSAIEGVAKVEPGHCLIWRNAVLRSRQYWTLNVTSTPRHDGVDEEALAAELRDRIEECVRARLVSERPLGAFLSGGLDSSAIVAAMSRIAPGTVRTFSIGFDEDSHNELPFARQVAQRYGTEHHELVVRPDAVELLPRLARCFDEPFADASAIPSYYLAEMTRRHVVVALNGDGGDEAFGGYLRYPAFLDAERKLSRPGLRAAIAFANALPASSQPAWFRHKLSVATSILHGTKPSERYGRYVSYFRPEDKARLLAPEFADAADDDAPYARFEQLWERYRNADPVNRLLAIDTATYLPGDLLPKVDITTMAVSLEARSPLLDHTLLEWTATLPGHLKVRGRTTKYLMKRALAPWLDSSLIHRRKMGFGVPLAPWFRGPLRDMVFDLVIGGLARDASWFDESAVRDLVDRHMAGENWAPQIYALVMLELWRSEVL
jgi:asparagine synthase (glutamine-hydrolysing)